MLADLVEVTTPEGIALSGAYFAPINVGRSYSVDAVLFFHGDGGHFYSSLYLWLGQRMAEQGIAFLTANRRGHDHVANGVRGGPSPATPSSPSMIRERTSGLGWSCCAREDTAA